MIDIDYIMSRIDWNKDIDEQISGIKMAENIKNFNVFLQPCNKDYNKNVWDNCAIIISKKTDYELSPYLFELLKWLKDLNWPGAYCILDRLQKYSDNPSFDLAFNACLKCARALEDDIWECNLKMIKREN